MSDVKCPKCGSVRIHAEKRGWSLTTGMNKIVLTCLQCGYQFKPRQFKPVPRLLPFYQVLLLLLLLVVLAYFVASR